MNIHKYCPEPPPNTSIRELPELLKVKDVYGIYIPAIIPHDADVKKFNFNCEGVYTHKGIIQYKLFGVLLIFVKILGFTGIPNIHFFSKIMINEKYNRGYVKLTDEDKLILKIYSGKAREREKKKINKLYGRKVYFHKPGKIIEDPEKELLGNDKYEYCYFIDFIIALDAIFQLEQDIKDKYWNDFIKFGNLYLQDNFTEDKLDELKNQFKKENDIK